MTQLEPPITPVVESVESKISKLQDRILDLELRLSALNDKINLTQGVPPVPGGSLPVEVVQTPAAHGTLIPTSKPTPTKKEAVKPSVRQEAGSRRSSFASNPSIDRFREAKILFDTRRYSDAVVEFSDFLKNDPDHPFAASAQYHLGMSYLEQKEYKLAEEELSRVLLSYPHSSHIPDTLLALHRVSEALKKAPRATYFKEKLLGQFPNSPQARGLSSAKATPKRSEQGAAPSSIRPEILEEPTVIESPSSPQAPEPPISGEAGHS
jgi:TolA-binding protein